MGGGTSRKKQYKLLLDAAEAGASPQRTNTETTPDATSLPPKPHVTESTSGLETTGANAESINADSACASDLGCGVWAFGETWGIADVDASYVRGMPGMMAQEQFGLDARMAMQLAQQDLWESRQGSQGEADANAVLAMQTMEAELYASSDAPPSLQQNTILQLASFAAGSDTMAAGNWICDGCGQNGVGKQRYHYKGCGLDFCDDCNANAVAAGFTEEPEILEVRLIENADILDTPDADESKPGSLFDLLKLKGPSVETEQFGYDEVQAKVETLGPESPATINDMLDLARFLEELREDYDKAEPLYYRALDGFEKSAGHADPGTLAVVSNLAWFLEKRQKKNDSSEPLYYKALDGFEKVFGHDHPTTLTCVLHVAQFLETHKTSYDKAEPLYYRALEGSETAFGHESLQTLTVVTTLAQFLENIQKEYDKAEQFYFRALEGYENVLGHDHPTTLTTMSNLVRFLTRIQKNYDKAEPLHYRLLEGAEQSYGPDSPQTLTIVNNLAVFMKQIRKDYEKAEPLYYRALEGREKALGFNHPDTLQSVNNLAVFLKQIRSDYAKAEPLFVRVVEGLQQVFGHDHPITQSSIESLKQCRKNV